MQNARETEKRTDDNKYHTAHHITTTNKLPSLPLGTFEMLVIDPPYITREVWAQYAITAKLLLAPNGRILLSTVAENAEMMKELLDVEPQVCPRWG